MCPYLTPSRSSCTQQCSCRAKVMSDDKFRIFAMSSLWKDLGIINTLLPLWIALAMVTGVLLGYYVPSVKEALDKGQFADVSAPIAAGMIWMMYPVMCKIDYSPAQLKKLNVKYLGFSLLVNWVVAPLFMVALGWATLPDLLDFRSGLIIVGTARCIAMVFIWNELAGGDAQLCAILVFVNLVLQIALYGPLTYVYVRYLGNDRSMLMAIWPAIRSVLVFLGIPLAAGLITRVLAMNTIGPKRFAKVMRYVGPTSLIALLYVIVVMFACQGKAISQNIGPVFRVVVPLLIYFGVIFTAVMAVCWWKCVPYAQMVTHAFTAASNNFELAIAVAGSIYGTDSKQAMAATVGPLVEVPVLVTLVYVVRWLNSKWYFHKVSTCDKGCEDLREVVFTDEGEAIEFNDLHKYKQFKAVTVESGKQKNTAILVLLVPYDDIRELEIKLLKQD